MMKENKKEKRKPTNSRIPNTYFPSGLEFQPGIYNNSTLNIAFTC